MDRHPEHDIEPYLLRRWSPRAMSGAPVTREDVMRLVEAARWAPSGGNRQPWRFVYALRDTTQLDVLLGLLSDGNREWCVRAGALVLLASQTLRDDGRELVSHSFDAGAAWMALALQGSAMGLVVHGIGGFDRELARRRLHVPADLSIDLMVAVGHPGRVEDLPERQREREHPSGRKPVSELAFEGAFPVSG